MVDKPILQIQDLTVSSNNEITLHHLDLVVGKEEVVLISGPHGVGKTTLLGVIAGIVPYQSGKLFLDGEDYYPVSHEIVKKGISYVTQGHKIIDGLTVKDNLEIGSYFEKTKSFHNDCQQFIFNYFPFLNDKKYEKAYVLTSSQQQILNIARGLMTASKLLMIDEPFYGLTPALSSDVVGILNQFNQKYHIPILIASQNLHLLVEIVNRTYVLDHGHIVTNK